MWGHSRKQNRIFNESFIELKCAFANAIESRRLNANNAGNTRKVSVKKMEALQTGTCKAQCDKQLVYHTDLAWYNSTAHSSFKNFKYHSAFLYNFLVNKIYGSAWISDSFNIILTFKYIVWLCSLSLSLYLSVSLSLSDYML